MSDTYVYSDRMRAEDFPPPRSPHDRIAHLRFGLDLIARNNWPNPAVAATVQEFARAVLNDDDRSGSN